MNTLQLLNLLENDQALGQMFLGVFPADQLPRISSLPSALIVNLDPSNKPGSHWVALYFNKSGNCEYFDSYGRHPDVLRSFIVKNSRSFVYNNIQVQNYWTTTCGKMCLYFLIWRVRGISFKNIIRSMCSDDFISNFINELFDIKL